jgi:hypothetical protein
MNRRRATQTLSITLLGAAALASLTLAQTTPPTPPKPAAPASAPAVNWAAFDATVQPFFNQNCISCHGAENPEGDVVLINFLHTAPAAKRDALLAKSFNMLSTGKMPPKDQPQPTPEAKRPVLAWLDGYNKHVDSLVVKSPGRVTLHRLNRVEYNNTLRDLLATDIQPANGFPVDDAGYGFDNNGDVLSLSPMLMEKYLNAAGLVLDRALFSPPVKPAPSVRVDAAALDGSIPKAEPRPAAAPGRAGGRGGAAGRVFNYNGDLAADFDAPASGRYIFHIRAYGVQRPSVQFSVDGKPAGRPVAVTETIQNTKVYDSEPIQVTAGKHKIALALTNGATKEQYDAAMTDIAARAATQPATAPATATAPAADRIPQAAAAPTSPPSSGPASAPATGPATTRGGRGGNRGNAGRAGAAAPAAPATPTGKPTLGVVYLEIEGPVDPTPDRMSESYQRIMVAYPSATVPRKQAAEKVIRNFATKAYRRPLADDEFNQLVALWAKYDAAGESFESALHTTLQAVLVSPYFLYRYERDPAATDAGGVRTIDEYELASRLSYFLWSTMPDDALFAAAEKNQLRANLDAQVDRMLKDPRARAIVDNFAGQWLKLRLVETATPDGKFFPAFDEPLREAMLTETRLFFLDILQNNKSVLDFIDADYTFLNERLAKHYGIPGVTGNEFRLVKLPSKDRGGLLTQASILTITSYPNRTSPVLRGKWVLENLFDQSPPPPPPNIPPLKDQGELTGTLRQRMEQHRLNPACATCHDQMDAIGFGLENFNAIGAYRTDDGGAPIDPAGTLEGGAKFSGPAELKQLIRARHDDFARTLASKLLTYSLGRGLEKFDRYAVDDLLANMKKSDYRFTTLIHDIVHSDPFQKRALP